MELRFTYSEFHALLNRVEVKHEVVEINNNIRHILMTYNNEVFRARFVYEDGLWVFHSFLEG